VPRMSRSITTEERNARRRRRHEADDDVLRMHAGILAEIRDAVVVTDVEGRITFWNDGATRIFGYTADEVLGRTPEFMYHRDEPDLAPRVGDDFVEEWRGIRKDGSTVWVQLHARPLLDDAGVPVGGIGVATDVTDRKRDDLERQRLAMAVEQAAESVVITDAEARIVYVNPSFERVTGYTRDEVIGKNPRILKSGVQSSTFYDAMWAAISNGLPWVADMTNRRKDGTVFQEEAVVTPMKDAAGTITGYVAVKRDVTRERALEAEGMAAIRERALIVETLRSLPIGTSSEATGQAVCQQVVSMSGLLYAHLVLFGEDGHAVPIGLATRTGQVAERRRLPIARSLQLHARASEGPWIEDWKSRPGHPHNQMLQDLGVRAAAYVPVRVRGDLVGLIIAGAGTSGAALALSNVLPGLVDFAEVAGALLQPTLAAGSDAAAARRRLAEVIDKRAFRAVFQPIVDLRSQEIAGFEALTRFADGARPDIAFSEARRLGMGHELEIATMREALIDAASLPRRVFLSLNASPTLITDDTGLAELLATRTRPIVFEVTEHEAIVDYDALRGSLHEIGRDLQIAVDDAGAGVANFHHLIGLRPQFIKVDQELVRGVHADPARQALIVALLHFARSTDCRVIAEGIETELERATLRKLGVELGQGFLLGRPGPASEFGEDAAAAGRATVEPAMPPFRVIRGARDPRVPAALE
jgi:PAS domain S-box-containing protein